MTMPQLTEQTIFIEITLPDGDPRVQTMTTLKARRNRRGVAASSAAYDLHD